MRHTTVLYNSPWVIAIGASLLAASFFTHGMLSKELTLASMVMLSAVMGALLTHLPPFPGTGTKE